MGASPAAAVVTFDLPDQRAADLLALCEAEDGAPREHGDSPTPVNCCMPGADWCVICTAGSVEAPKSCVSLGVPPAE